MFTDWEANENATMGLSYLVVDAYDRLNHPTRETFVNHELYNVHALGSTDIHPPREGWSPPHRGRVPTDQL